MYKVIDLGFQVESTGEKRVQLIDTQFTKTASSEIQMFWDSLERKKDRAYLWVIGVSAMEYYGCNNNGDAFTEEDLKRQHNTFVSNAHVFLHHVNNKDPNKSIGKPVYSFYNDVMHRVEIIMEIDKNANGASDIVSKISNGDPIFVSMGCNIPYDECSICNNRAKHRGEYCVHLRYNMKKILPDGRQVYALNHNPKFFDISIVRKPADSTAFTLDKAASEGSYSSSDSLITSAELGELVQQQISKLAALDKMSDLIKRIDGQITDLKDEDQDINVLRQVARQGFDNFEYPDFDIDELKKNKVGPRGLAEALLSEGSPITLGDSMYMAGRHCFGDDLHHGHMHSMLKAMPAALSILRKSPRSLSDIAQEIFQGDDEPVDRTIIIKIIRPVAHGRINLLGKFASDAELEKIAFGTPIPGATAPLVPANRKTEAPDRVTSLFSDNVPGNLRELSFVGHDGKTYRTTYGDVRGADIGNLVVNTPKNVLGGALITAALISIASDPTQIQNLAAGLLTGSMGMSLLGRKDPKVKTDQGYEVPVNTFFTKSATAAPVAKASKAIYAGMAIPAALGMDYVYNKWKYKGEDPEWHLNSGVARAAHRTGKAVVDNPVTSVVGGAAAGALGKHLLAKAFKR